MGISRKLVLVNFLTILRFIAAGVFIFLAYYDYWLEIFFLAPVVFLTDKLDGTLARRWQAISSFGKTADPLADKVVTIVLLFLIINHYGYTSIYMLLAGIILLYDLAVTGLWIDNQRMGGEIPEAKKLGKYKTAVLMSGIVLAVTGIAFVDVEYVGILAKLGGQSLLAIATVMTLLAFKDYWSEYQKHKK